MKRILIALLTATILQTTAFANKVTIELNDGGKFVGKLDRRTTAQRIWLRYRHGSTTLLRPVSWQRIRSVQSTHGKLTPLAATKLANQSVTKQQQETAARHRADVSQLARTALGFSPKIRQVHLQATATNKKTGRAGSLQVCLKARPCQVVPRKANDMHVHGVVQIKWTHLNRTHSKALVRKIYLADFQSERGAIVHLPFDTRRPDKGSDIKLTLIVPGHGTFRYSFEYSK